MVFAPRRPLNETYEIWTGDGVMVAYLAPPHPEEQAFRVIRVGLSLVADTIGFFVADPVRREPRRQSVPRTSLVGIERRVRGGKRANEVKRIALVAEHAG
jgi:hypothetical protein